MSPLPLSLRIFALTAAGAATATLARSLLFERWLTVFASTALVVGAVAVLRDRTWGLPVALAGATSFAAAAAFGMGPGWFWIVAFAGVLPFVSTFSALRRFDATSAWSLAIGGVAAGVGATAIVHEYGRELLHALGA